MLCAVVEELKKPQGVSPLADALEVPAGEHARAGVDVAFRKLADANREQLHDFAREILLRTRSRVEAAVEPVQHGRVFRYLDEKIPEVRQRIVAEQLQLAPEPARMLRSLCRHHLRGALAADGIRDLAVRGREMLVPEQRHLFLQRAPRVHHAEQPPLARVIDRRGRRERFHRAGRWRHGRIPSLTDERVDVVWRAVIVHELGQRGVETARTERRRFGGARTKAGATQQVLNPRISGHRCVITDLKPETWEWEGSYTNWQSGRIGRLVDSKFHIPDFRF